MTDIAQCNIEPSLFNLNRTQRSVLAVIREHSELPRSQIASMCGVSAPAITRIARELLSRDLIVVSGRGGNTRGQPLTQLSINPKGAYSIGLFIERDVCSITIIDFSGAMVFEQRFKGTFDTPQKSLPLIFKHLDSVLQSHAEYCSRLAGIGIAVTGNFVIDGHTVVPPQDMEAWINLDIATVFREKYPHTIIVENDGSASALGERLTGRGRQYKSFFHIYMGNGLGGGYVFNGKLMRGAHGNASELGHMIPKDRPRPTLLSLAKALACPVGDVTNEYIESLFHAQDDQFFSWLDEAIENLNGPVNAIAILMDPEAIVLGGRFPTVVTNYVIRKLTIEDYGSYWESVPRPVLVQAKIKGEDATVYGAAALPLYEYLLPDNAE